MKKELDDINYLKSLTAINTNDVISDNDIDYLDCFTIATQLLDDLVPSLEGSWFDIIVTDYEENKKKYLN